ncbi:MAG TPA: 50S ribosomal protein L11 methyltransferase [Puia sp.]|nr:50S ribosomal protein L11 methyltransferase [Puia sp.]
MNTYIEITIPVSNEQESDMLVAQLSRIGFEGFEEEEGLLHAFIPEMFYAEEELIKQLQQAAGNSENKNPLFTRRRIEPRNWNADWEKDFQPVVIDDFCAIRAAFHDPIPGVQYELQITPKMSFGTGHHATTYLMIEAMRSLDFSGSTVLDFGTGTGILAILAEKLGAASVRAIDNDDWSIENARENLKVNKATAISLAKKDNLIEEGVFDIILANINLRVLLDSMGEMRQHLALKGVIMASGVLQTDEQELSEAARKAGLVMQVLGIRDNWMSFSLKKRESVTP